MVTVQERTTVQRKPADIDKTWDVQYDSTGKRTTPPGTRAKVKRALVINAQARDGWVQPTDQLTGGHLLKREYGGPDDETNVVPWMNTTEQAFTKFEDSYGQQMEKDAQDAAASANPFNAQVHTKAQFKDRRDLKVSNKEMELAGWKPSDPGWADRISQFNDVAEQFSGIPISVSVQVDGLTGGTLLWDASNAGIAPAYQRNDDAIKPTFKPSRYPFDPKANISRLWVSPNWSDQKDVVRKALHHEFSRHRTAWGFGPDDNFQPKTKKNPATTGTRFAGMVEAHINASNTDQIIGAYRGTIECIHYVNSSTRLWACTDKTGHFLAGFKLSQSQYDDLLLDGNVR